MKSQRFESLLYSKLLKLRLLFFYLLISVQVSAQTRYDVSSEIEFDTAHDQASAGDTIAWLPGVYSGIFMEIDKDGLIVTAEPYGTVLFTGVSRAIINADNIVFSGLQYIGGLIGNLNVINVYGSDVWISHINIQNYTSYKYLVVDEDSKRTTISYCNFENRLNLDDKNILSILVDDEPGYHKIQYSSFKNFDGIGNDMGIEPIRIGVSSQGHLDSRTLVEYCYFTQCSGDGEIISHKSRQNVYRYNTFENNPLSEFVLRHGDEGIVYGNFFLNNKGGIRIREGSDHFIFNNYFEGIDQRSLWLMNDPVDPLNNVHIYHNTFVDTEEIRLGGSGNDPPTNVTIANNVFTDPLGQLFDEETGNEIWINNLAFGSLGIDSPSTGLSYIDPMLYENIEGFFQPEATSPVLATSSEAYPAVPLYPGMDYDSEISLDIMKETRPDSIADRAIGASEYSATTSVQPHANEMNTGPSYLFDNLVDYLAANLVQLYIGNQADTKSVTVSSNINWTVSSDVSWISSDLSSGTGDAQFEISIDTNTENVPRSGTVTIMGGTQTVTIDVSQDAGPVGIVEDIESDLLIFPNPTDGIIKLSNMPSEIYKSSVELRDIGGRLISTKDYQINRNELLIHLDHLDSGTYLLTLKLLSKDGKLRKELSRKIVRN